MRYHKLNSSIFIENRKKFTAHLKPNAIAIFTSNDMYPTSADAHLPFKQHSDILYLSGADQEESILVLFPNAHKEQLREVLFLKETNDHIAIWEGEKLTKKRAFEVSGIKTVYWLQDLNKVIEYFSRKKAHIVGLSMGGRIAFTFFKNFPSKVASLVLCDTHKGFKHFTEEQQNEFIRLRKEPLISGKEPSDIAPIVAKTLIGNINNSDVYEQLVDSMNRLHKLSYIKSIEASVKSDHTDILNKIDVPTLVVVGELDTLTPPDLAKEIANEIPNAKLEIISGAGHLSNIEQPDIFNNKVIKFLLNLR